MYLYISYTYMYIEAPGSPLLGGACSRSCTARKGLQLQQEGVAAK